MIKKNSLYCRGMVRRKGEALRVEIERRERRQGEKIKRRFTRETLLSESKEGKAGGWKVLRKNREERENERV